MATIEARTITPEMEEQEQRFMELCIDVTGLSMAAMMRYRSQFNVEDSIWAMEAIKLQMERLASGNFGRDIRD